jgi:putative FmdB family regulatory protein
MPYYEYRCAACGQQFDALQSFEEHDRHEDHDRHEPLACPHCGSSQVEQQLSSPVFVITSKKS